MLALHGGLPEVGDLLADKYRLVGVLGRGGMGVVFDAHHELLERKVAVKVLAPEVSASAEAVTRFMNEARAAARIASDRVVAVLDVGTLPNGLPYMVMERLEGHDLGEVDLKHGALPILHMVNLVVEAIEGVSHAHLEGIIHRDLKPSNLFVARGQDNSTVVKVLDFGISKLTTPGAMGGALGNVTSTNAVLGSPLYMSPEQLRSTKNIDVRADVWSLGVITYELLTGRLPFTAETMVDLYVSIQETDARPPTELREDIPPALSMAVLRSLRRVPADRYASAFEFGKALEPFGGARAQAAMQRLEARMMAKGVVPQSLPPRDPSAQDSTQKSSAPSASANMPAAAAVSAGPPPRMGGSTAAPWSVTGGDTARSSVPSRTALVLVPLAFAAMIAVAGGALFFHRGGPTSGGTSAASASSPAAPSAIAAPTPTPTPTPTPNEVTPAASGSAAVETPTQPAPSATPPTPAAATVAPRKDPARLKMPSLPASVAPASPRPAAAAPSVNPMSMKPF